MVTLKNLLTKVSPSEKLMISESKFVKLELDNFIILSDQNEIESKRHSWGF